MLKCVFQRVWRGVRCKYVMRCHVTDSSHWVALTEQRAMGWKQTACKTRAVCWCIVCCNNAVVWTPNTAMLLVVLRLLWPSNWNTHTVSWTDCLWIPTAWIYTVQLHLCPLFEKFSWNCDTKSSNQVPFFYSFKLWVTGPQISVF